MELFLLGKPLSTEPRAWFCLPQELNEASHSGKHLIQSLDYSLHCKSQQSDEYLIYVLKGTKKKWEVSPLLPVSCTSSLKNNFWEFKISIFSVLLFFVLLRFCICVVSQLSKTHFRFALKRDFSHIGKKNCSLHRVCSAFEWHIRDIIPYFTVR